MYMYHVPVDFKLNNVVNLNIEANIHKLEIHSSQFPRIKTLFQGSSESPSSVVLLQISVFYFQALALDWPVLRQL